MQTMAAGGSPTQTWHLAAVQDQDNTMSPGGKQASHTNLFFTALTSSDLSLSIAHGPLSAPFSPYPTIYSLPIMELIPPLSEQTALS